MKLSEILSDKGKHPKSVGTFAKGFLAPFRAWRVVRERKGLKRFFVIPFFLNIVLLSSLVYLSFSVIYPFLQGLLPQGDAWYLSALRWAASPVLLLTLAVITVLLYSITGNIIAAPFNDLLSARVETLVSGENFDEKFSIAAFSGDMMRMTGNVFKLLLMMIAFNIAILFFNFLPLFGSVLYAALNFLSTMFFLGFQFFDFPLERRRLVFRDKLRVVWEYRYMNMGLGLGFFLISIIPLLGFLGLNLGTVGGTMLFIENIKPRMITGRERKGTPW